ncbi:MAG: glycosyltransferase family 9 protein [Omnitrophica WOR_2 bacterium]
MNQNLKLKNPEPERITILRALQLGDLLCAVPAFRSLRSAFPNALISLIGLPWAVDFVARFNAYIDDFIEFPGYPGFPEQPAQIHKLPSFLQSVQQSHYDLALQMQGSGGISNSLVVTLGAERNAGFYLPGEYCPDPERFFSYPVHEPEVWRHLRLMEFLGVPLLGNELEFPLNSNDWEQFHDLQEKYDLEGCNYVVIHPGARSLARRWPTAWFAAVADGMAERGLRVVLTGTSEEAYLSADVASQMKAPALDLAGQTSLGSLAALLSASRLLVSNDTGVSHIADALKVPSVILFTASDPNRWAPVDRSLHRIVAWATTAVPQVVLDEVDALLLGESADVMETVASETAVL